MINKNVPLCREIWEIAVRPISGKQLKAVITKELMCFRLSELRTRRLLKHESAHGEYSVNALRRELIQKRTPAVIATRCLFSLQTFLARDSKFRCVL